MRGKTVSSRWALGTVHPDEVIAEPGVTEGSPSRWITLRAMRGDEVVGRDKGSRFL